jgi:ATP-binding cassette, subfamily B, bacterial
MPATHRQVLAFLWRYTRRHALLLSAMAFILLVSTGVGLAQPFFYKEVIDSIARSSEVNYEVMRYALFMTFLGVLFGMAHISLHELSSFMLARIETRVMRRAHADVFAHAQRLSSRFHVNAFAGATSRKIGRGTDAIEHMLDIMWFNFFPLVASVVGFVIVLSFFAPLIGVAIIVCMVIYIPVSVALNLVAARYTAWSDRQDTRVTASLVDTITGNATTKAFGAESAEDIRHGKVLGEWERRLWITWRLGSGIAWIQSMMMMLVELVLLSLAVWLWYKGQFTAGGFIVITFYVGRLWGYMHDIGKNVRNYLRSNAHAEEMVGLYRTPFEVADCEDTKIMEVVKGAIAFQNVTFSYERTSGPIFRDFSVDIEAGEKIALVGHSGGGKSTIVKLLLRLYDLDSGRIMIDGQNITEITQKSLRKSIGLMPQDPLLFHRSIAENIAYGKPNAGKEEIERVAKLAHAHEFIKHLPKGYDTLVGERGVKLSGGERQRVAIARAILADTPILILDEATSSLDSLSEKHIQEALEYLMKGRTTIVIAHRLSTIKKADRILVIDAGEILEEGSHSSLIRKNDGIYKNFYELQAGGFIGE